MTVYAHKLAKRGLIQGESFIHGNLQYEVITGSMAYGVSGDSSDVDVVGFTIPPKDVVFPHTAGFIAGFGPPPKSFDQFQSHHIKYSDTKQIDMTIYNIVKFFHLCAEGNPNMVDVLFVPDRCVTHCTQVGERVRERRRLFLSKKSWHTFKGYAYSQLHKMDIRNPAPGSKRAALMDEFGYDTKYAYHLVRLLCEVEQILVEEDLDLERDRELLKAIRRGEWTEHQVRSHFEASEKRLTAIYDKSSLRYKPEWGDLRILLSECLEAYYGSMDECLTQEGAPLAALREIRAIAEKVTP